MPKVRLLADGAGRYEVSKGELFLCTEEEFARWEPAGVVELADAPKAERAPTPEEAQAAVEAAAAAPKPVARRTRRKSE